jgi:hypothetical protein|tara:strand:- start:21814 stop:22239 length:426 start_codon:yes stop_codon:yes gene_type:complete
MNKESSIAPEFSVEPMTLERVYSILSKLKSAPSGIQMSTDKDYRFEAVEINHENEMVDGFLIRCGFVRPDTNSGEMGEGFGRWNHVQKNASAKAVIMTAFVAIKLVVEHEMLEAFEYQGEKLFNPHKSLDELAYPQALLLM